MRSDIPSSPIDVAIDNAGDVVLPIEGSTLSAYVENAIDGGWSEPTTIPSTAGTQFALSIGINAATGDAVVTHGVGPSDGGQVVESFAYTGAPKAWDLDTPPKHP